MSKEIRELLFSNQCYEAPTWLFPEIDLSEKSADYNPVIDAIFGDLVEYPLPPKNDIDIFTALKTVHETQHMHLFNTTHRGIMQLQAGVLYALFELLVSDIESNDAVNYQSKARKLESTYQTGKKVEEVLALYGEICDLNKLVKPALKDNSDNPKTIKRIQDVLEDSVLKKAREKYGSGFVNLYNLYNDLATELGDHRKLIDRFVLNTPIPESFPVPLLKASSEVGFILYNEEERANLSNLHYANATPEERLRALHSQINGTLTPEMKEKSKAVVITYLDITAPGFAEGCLYYDSTFIPLVKELIQSNDFLDDNQITMMAELILARNYLVSKRSGDVFDRINSPYVSGDLERSLIEEKGPSFYISENHFQINNQLLNNRVLGAWLIFYELIRQQIEKKEGLECLGRYFSDYCPLAPEGNNGEKCLLKDTLIDAWNYTSKEFFPNSTKWTKPECL